MRVHALTLLSASIRMNLPQASIVSPWEYPQGQPPQDLETLQQPQETMFWAIGSLYGGSRLEVNQGSTEIDCAAVVDES